MKSHTKIHSLEGGVGFHTFGAKLILMHYCFFNIKMLHVSASFGMNKIAQIKSINTTHLLLLLIHWKFTHSVRYITRQQTVGKVKISLKLSPFLLPSAFISWYRHGNIDMADVFEAEVRYLSTMAWRHRSSCLAIKNKKTHWNFKDIKGEGIKS